MNFYIQFHDYKKKKSYLIFYHFIFIHLLYSVFLKCEISILKRSYYKQTHLPSGINNELLILTVREGGCHFCNV